MKSEQEISVRLQDLKEKVQLIRERREDELKKQFRQRDYRLLKFLSKENEIYSFALSQLQWLLVD